MYLPPHFEESRVPVLRELLRARPLASFIVSGGDDIVVNHLPLILMAEDGVDVLRGHVPRTNPVWTWFDGREAIAVFHGPEAYVSPSWYPSKQQHGKVVPTWNYSAVHVRGCPRAVHDAGWLTRHLSEMTDRHESAQEQPWRFTDAPAEFTERLVGQLVGLEMPVAAIVGKWKVSQNRPIADRLGVAAGLRRRGDDGSRAMSDLVMATIDQRDPTD